MRSFARPDRSPRPVLKRAILAICLLLAGPALADGAGCGGRDLLADMSPAARAALVGDAPYARGNVCQATRGPTTITVAGTYHLNDPRFDSLVPKLLPYLDGAAALLVEAGPDAERALQADIAAHPDRIVNTTGPTLPEALSPADWQTLSRAMALRGMPAFVAAKFQPWYVAMLLGLPPCRLQPDAANGLDQRLIAAATARHIPVTALEPWDTAIRLFADVPWRDQIDLLRLSLASEAASADMATTLANAYFAGEHRLIWDFSRKVALQSPGADPAAFDRMERVMLTDRTRAWVPGLIAAAEGRQVLVAVGAAHLGGSDGLLNLLAQAGFTLRRLPF